MYSSCAFTSESHRNLGGLDLNCQNRKRYCSDTCSKHNETVKCDYYRWSSELKGGISEVVWPEAGSPIPAVETSNIIEGDNENVSERFLSILIEFSDILMRAAKRKD